MSLEMTYQEYLDSWQERYGDADSGEAEYWAYGRPAVKVIHRLSEAEFNRAFAVVKESFDKIDADQKKPVDEQDGPMQDRLFAKSFPCELALLM